MPAADKPAAGTVAAPDEQPATPMGGPTPAVVHVIDVLTPDAPAVAVAAVAVAAPAVAAPAVAAPAVAAVAVTAPAPAPVPVPSPSHAVLPQAMASMATARPSVHSAGTYIVGDIASLGPLHLEGSVKGTVRCQQLSIGRDGAVVGRIDAGQMRLEGRVEGDLVCDRLEMNETARLQGSLVCKVLVLTHGAALQGDITVG